MPLNLQPKCVENLKKLRDFLWDNHEKIKVDMKWYGDLPLEDYERPVEALAECGSVGCAIGWAPKVVPVSEEYLSGTSVLYGPYAHREFCRVENGSNYNKDTVFKALFGYHWSDAHKDPTTLGVIFRIDTVLKLNDIPDELILDIDACDDEYEYKRMIRAYHKLRAEWLKEQGIQ